MTFHRFKKTLIVFTVLWNPIAYSTDLMEVYYEALDNDPTFKSAYSVFMAESQSIPITAAALIGIL